MFVKVSWLCLLFGRVLYLVSSWVVVLRVFMELCVCVCSISIVCSWYRFVGVLWVW